MTNKNLLARTIIQEEPEHVFYAMGSDYILFVHKDGDGTRWLCSCCRLGEEWVICQVATATLLDLIDDGISIRDAFEADGAATFFAKWDGRDVTTTVVLPYDALPRAGAKLELGYERTGAYREMLRKELGQA